MKVFKILVILPPADLLKLFSFLRYRHLDFLSQTDDEEEELHILGSWITGMCLETSHENEIEREVWGKILSVKQPDSAKGKF